MAPVTKELSTSAKVWATLSSVRAGEDWKASVAEAVGRSDAVVLLLTPYATDEAGGLVRELAFVLDRAADQDKPVATFRLGTSDLPERLAGRFWGTLPETGAADQNSHVSRQVARRRPEVRWRRSAGTSVRP